MAAIPFAGGSIVELLNLALKLSLEARRDAFLSDLASRLEALEKRGTIRMEDLVGNELFTDVVLQAAMAALRTRSLSKREALRNAVLNSILPSAPEADLQELFIGFVDSFSPWHLAILSLLSRNPAETRPGMHEAPRVNMALGALVEEAFAELRGKAAVYSHFLADLQASGLLAVPPRGGALVDAQWAHLKLTELGHAFLVFISEPEAPAPTGV